MPPEAAAAPAPAVRALTCPSCGGTVTVRAAGYTVTMACLYCGSLLDVSDPDVRLITEYQQAAAATEIPLGRRGTLRGIEWEAIGYLEKSENGGYPWVEYLLFNPYHGYRWLVSDGRGWSLGEMLTSAPSGASTLRLDNESYEPFFATARAQVDYVLGEFYWRVAVGEEVETADFVRPGWMLSKEANDKEINWTLSELLDPKEMQSAFGVELPGPAWAPLPHQPSPYAGFLGPAARVAIAAALVLALLAMFMGSGNLVFSHTMPVAFDEKNFTSNVGPIRLNRPYQAIDIRTTSPDLENGWIDFDYALVSRETQASYEAYAAAERYSGRDSDGPWTEGSRGAHVKIASVPRGTYDLVVDYSGHRWSQTGAYFDPRWDDNQARHSVLIEVRQASLFAGNFWIALILLGLPLIFAAWRHLSFEKARQEQSDFGPSGLAAMFQGDDE
jgi:hypothetical protein